MKIHQPFHLIHKPTGKLVGVRGGELILTASTAAAPVFTAENTGPSRADDFHVLVHAQAYKTFGRSALSRKGVL